MHHFELPHILCSNPTSFKGMITWETAAGTIAKLPEGSRRLFLDCNLKIARNHINPAIRYLVGSVIESAAIMSQERMALLGAATTDLSVFVRRRGDHNAYEVGQRLWNGEVVLTANPVAAALSGVLLTCNVSPSWALENELANAELYLQFSAFQKLIGHRGGTVAIRKRKADEIISRFKEEKPGERMLRADFLSRMRTAIPGASTRSLLNTFNNAKPAEWKKGGRPPGRSAKII